MDISGLNSLIKIVVHSNEMVAFRGVTHARTTRSEPLF